MTLFDTIKATLLLALTSLLCGGCMLTIEPDFLEFEAKIVVDGSIVVGERPEIVLTQLIPPDSDLDSATLSNVPLRWAKITLYCGDESEVLVGSRDEKYMTQFYYRSLHMSGEQGKSYSIEVEYGGVTVSATTALLEPVPLVDLWVEPVSERDSTFIIKAQIDDPAGADDYYLISSMVVGQDSIYKPTVLGVWSDQGLNLQENVVPVFRSLSILQTGADMGLFYKSGEQVFLEVAHVEKEVYDYYLDQQELFINVANPLYPVTTNARTNIEGGLGCWAGKAVYRYSISIPEV